MMSIFQEVLSRVRSVHQHATHHESKIIENINSVWKQFIFKDLRKAKSLKNKGYDFTLLGQDIYDRGVDLELPTGHYSYCLIITYKGKYINPFNHNKKLKKILYDELMNDFIYISECPMIYTSIYRESISADIFLCTHESNESNDILRINNIIGDSLLYFHISIPYLRFDSEQPIRFSRYGVNDTHIINKKVVLTIQLETHIYDLTPSLFKYDFII